MLVTFQNILVNCIICCFDIFLMSFLDEIYNISNSLLILCLFVNYYSMDVEEPEIHPVPVRGQVGRRARAWRNFSAGQSSRVRIIPSDRTDFNVTSTTLLGDNPVREVPLVDEGGLGWEDVS